MGDGERLESRLRRIQQHEVRGMTDQALDWSDPERSISFAETVVSLPAYAFNVWDGRSPLAASFDSDTV